MGFLTATRTVSTSRTVNATASEALRILHDPKKLIHLNPLVIASTQDGADSALWHITDRLQIACIQTTTTYSARFTLVDDGIDSDTNASGVHIVNKWRASPKGAEEVEISEEAIVETSVFLAGYVTGQLKTSHAQLLQALAEQLEGPDRATNSSAHR